MSSSIGIGGAHDLGGVGNTGPIVLEEKPITFWQQSVHALAVSLASRTPCLVSTDELRRATEQLEPECYKTWGYYEKWAAAIASLLVAKGIVSQVELDRELFGNGMDKAPEVLFKPGDKIRVRPEDTRLRWRRPHLRCPGYIYGLAGVVKKFVGLFDDPFLLAYKGEGPQQPLYVVSIPMSSIWSHGLEHEVSDCGSSDCVELDIYQEWLESDTGLLPDMDKDRNAFIAHAPTPILTNKSESAPDPNQLDENGVVIPDSALAHPATESIHDVSHDHKHSHDHDGEEGIFTHSHLPRDEIECNAAVNEGEDPPGKVVGEALLRVLYTKGVITQQEILTIISNLENAGAKMLGMELVVKAWLDPAFKRRLVEDACAAGAELGIKTSNPNAPTVLRVVENTPAVHNVIVCTLCSCYPIGLLGFSPAWYKSRSYRARVVREPRRVLAEFGTTIPPEVGVVVHDATADCRYLVLPMRPKHLQDCNDPAILKAAITRDSMIGVTML